MLKTKNRIFYFDFLRCFAILAVIACHVFAEIVLKKKIFGSTFWFYSLFLNSLRDIGVPLFVMISGALLLNRKDSLIKFVKKRMSRVVVPYVFWMLIFVIFLYVFANMGFYFGGKVSFIDAFFKIFTVSYPKGIPKVYWFVQMLIIVYALIFILNKINEVYPNILKIALIISLITIVLMNFGFINYGKPFNYPFFFVFAILGYYLSKTDFTSKSLKINENKLTIVFLILSIILYILQVSVIAKNSLDLNKFIQISQFSFLNIIIVSFVFLFARYFSLSHGSIKKVYDKIKDSKVGDVINSISITSFGIYLCHMIVFISLKVALYSFEKQWGDPIFSNVLFILTIIFSWGIILILNKIPYLNRISGVG